MKLVPTKQAASIEALRIIQHHRGWVSDESIRDLSLHLGLTVDELDSNATYYNLIFRKPAGRHVIFVCDSVSCWVVGYEKILEHISGKLGKKLGETTEDGKFTLLPIVCLGVCEQAPAMMVDQETFGNLIPERVDEILARYD